MFGIDPGTLVLLIPVFLLAITCHELSHGLVALHFGDPTAQRAGRLTMNPISHLDPMGTVAIFLIGLGWAKPVPVDARYFANPKRHMLWVALAGPGSNMVLAFISGLIIQYMNANQTLFNSSFIADNFAKMIYLSLQINLMLAVFNLLTIPPLDGSKMLYSLLPPKYEYIAYNLERYGPMILIGLIVFGWVTRVPILWAFIGPFVVFFSRLFTGG